MAEFEQIEMTQEGFQKLKDELEHRKLVERAEIAERIKVALSFGDLSENAEYEDAKQAQGENEGRIAELEATLKNVRVIESDEISKTKITLGSTFTLKDEALGETVDYTLVSAKEEDIFENKISTDSPVGAAVIGKKRGQVIAVKTPMGQLKYKIVKIG